MSDEGRDNTLRRRQFLRTIGGAAAIASTPGVTLAQANGTTGSTTVRVGPNGRLVFEPATVRIRPGESIEWVWDSPGHNVVSDQGDWGHEPLENAGYAYSYTFEEPAEYSYVCEPHASAGMTGTVTVGTGVGTTPEDSTAPGLPGVARLLGVVAAGVMVVTLGGYLLANKLRRLL
jgi:plastocyanin